MTNKDNPFPPGARVAGYFRDSGGDEQDLSVSRQLAEFRRWLQEHQLVEGATFTDAARPGSSVIGREAFQRMMRHFRTGAPEAGLAIWRSNRFGRNINDTQFYKADLRRQGYIVYSLTDHIPQDRYGKLIEFVLDWKDEEFLHALSEDVSSGLRNIVQAYGAVPGTPPHGFLREPVEVGLRRDGRPHLLHRWVPDPTLAPQVRRAFQMLVQREPLSRIHLATGLYGSLNSYATFFRNALYKGELRFGDLVINDYCDPVVDRALWDRAQLILDRRSHRNSPIIQSGPDSGLDPRRQGSPWLLSGLLHCARCASPMNGHVINSWNYYACSRHTRRRDCDAPKIPSAPLEQAVVDRLREYLGDPLALAAAQSDRYRLYQAAVADLPVRQNELAVRLENLRRQIGHLTDAVADGRYSPALLDRLTALESQEFELKNEQDALRALLDSAPHQLTPEEMQRAAARLEQRLAAADPQDRRRALAGWVHQVRAERQGNMIIGQLELYVPPSDDPQVKKKRLSRPELVEGSHPEFVVPSTVPPWGHLPVTLQIQVPIPQQKRGRKPSK